MSFSQCLPYIFLVAVCFHYYIVLLICLVTLQLMAYYCDEGLGFRCQTIKLVVNMPLLPEKVPGKHLILRILSSNAVVFVLTSYALI